MNAAYRRAEDGASAVEYGLLVAGIAAVIVTIVFLLGGAIAHLFSDSCGTIRAQAGSAATCS